jgi:hypothetical protein
MKDKLPLSFAIALVFCAPLVIHAEEGVMVPIERPEKVGDKVKLRIEAEESMNMLITAGGEKLDEKVEEWKASIEMSRKIDKVNEEGEATELTLEIHKFSVTRGDETKDELEAGTVIKATMKDGEETFAVNDEIVPESIGAILKSATEMSDEAKGDENKAFGVDEPRKVGEEWEVDMEEFLSTMPDDFPMSLKKDSLKGKVQLVEIVGAGEDKAGKLTSAFEMLIDSMKGMPPGAEFNQSTLKGTQNGVFPLDTTRQPTVLEMTMEMDLKGTIPMPDGGKAEMKLDVAAMKKSEVIP